MNTYTQLQKAYLDICAKHKCCPNSQFLTILLKQGKEISISLEGQKLYSLSLRAISHMWPFISSSVITLNLSNNSLIRDASFINFMKCILSAQNLRELKYNTHQPQQNWAHWHQQQIAMQLGHQGISQDTHHIQQHIQRMRSR
jgi:hypothetical protein